VKKTVIAIVIATLVLILIAAINLMAPRPAAVAATSAANNPSGAWCEQTGGLVETRHAVYGTNGSNPLDLADTRQFCQYTSATDGSRIHVTLETLNTPKPTLAALAYYAQVQPGQCNGNPASCYCTLLGGSDLFGGINAAGGGWYNQNSIDQTLEACIFPDMSSIDSFGLFYHSAGIIRGIDLGTVLKYPNPY